MKESFRLGRLRGIEIGAHWSVLAVAALIWATVATSVLPSLSPDHSPAAYWVVGMVIALAFFASLLAHELAHSVMAQHHGVEVERITLWLLGGVSTLHDDTPTASEELQIAVVGPLTSAVIGVVAFVLAAIALEVPGLTVLGAGLVWLAVMNLVLAVFNLMPAFPLDGGRVLRAWLWRRSGDRVAATAQAARVGQAFAVGLVALGIFAIAGEAVVTGIWFGFLGWFLYSAATTEAVGVTQRSLLDGVPVAEVMTAHPVTVPADLSVAALVDEYVLGRPHSAYPVLGPLGEPTGIVTLDSVRRVPPDERAGTPVGAVAFGLDGVAVVAPTAGAPEALAALLASPAGRALVVENGRLVGLVSTKDMANAVNAHALLREQQAAAEAAARRAAAPPRAPASGPTTPHRHRPAGI